jgi:hypothetical protein
MSLNNPCLFNRDEIRGLNQTPVQCTLFGGTMEEGSELVLRGPEKRSRKKEIVQRERERESGSRERNDCETLRRWME